MYNLTHKKEFGFQINLFVKAFNALRVCAGLDNKYVTWINYKNQNDIV